MRHASEFPWRLTGLDIHLRVCWRWPFWRCYIGKVWHLPKPEKIELSNGMTAIISERSELP